MRDHLEYLLDLRPEEAMARLAGAIDLERWPAPTLSGYAGRRPFIGQVGRDRFRVQKRRSYRNGFAPQLYGTVVPEAGHTRIVATFEMRLATRVALLIYYASMAIVSAIVVVSVASSHRRAASDLLGLTVTVVLIFFVPFCIVKVGQLVAAPEKKALREFMDALFGPLRVQ